MIKLVNLILILILLFVVPVILGLFALPMFGEMGMKKNNPAEKGMDKIDICICIPYGIAIMLALFHILSVPMIAIKGRFSVLKNAWFICVVILCILSIFFNRKYFSAGIKNPFTKKTTTSVYVIWIFAIAIILFQTWLLAFNMHMDTDDVRFISEALEAYDLDSMLMIHPITGTYLGVPMGEMVKELSAPYPFFIATISKITGVHPAITAHTVFPMVLIPLSYIVIYLLGKFFFEQSGTDNEEKKIAVYMLIASIIILFSFESVYSFGYTLLTIIWQGRSILATVMLPLLWITLMKYMSEDISLRLCIFIVIIYIACVDLSGMGTICTMCLGGAYCVAYAIVSKSIKKSIIGFVLLIPVFMNFAYYLYTCRAIG